MTPILIIGLGGTTRPCSSTERAVAAALRATAERGAQTVMFGAADLPQSPYAPEASQREASAIRLVDQLRRADGVIVGSPGYHGGISGLIKNALDYTEDMRADPRPYLEGRAVGCVASAAGWQAGATTLVALRSVIHALRGWPTPLGVAINSAEPVFDDAGGCLSSTLQTQLDTLAEQVMFFARATRAMAA